MLVSLIVAYDLGRVIGRDNAMPWHLPADMRRFRRLTMGKAVLMGRATHESIGRALDGRTNVVLSRDPAYRSSGCIVAGGLDAALQACADESEAVVIGGARIYALALPRVERMYLTEIEHRFEGDTRFPCFDRREWREIAREAHPATEAFAYPYTYVDLERRTTGG